MMPEVFLFKSFLILTFTWFLNFSKDLTELSGPRGCIVEAPWKGDWDLGGPFSIIFMGVPVSFLKHYAAVADIIAYKFSWLALELFLLVFNKNLFCFGNKSRLFVR